MKITDAQLLAIKLIAKFGLTDYTFEFTDAVDYFGFCHNSKKLITLSRKLVELNDETQVTDTILHEIAHALTPGCAHNEIWVRVAKAIGANGQRCYAETVETPVHKWTATCPTCKKTVQYHKRNKRLHCSTCHKKTGRFSKANKFVWHKN